MISQIHKGRDRTVALQVSTVIRATSKTNFGLFGLCASKPADLGLSSAATSDRWRQGLMGTLCKRLSHFLILKRAGSAFTNTHEEALSNCLA